MPEIVEWLHMGRASPLVLCFTETCLSSTDSICPIDGFVLYCSPFLRRLDKSKWLLLGSCVFASSTLSPEHPSICDEVEQMCRLINISCCIVTCEHHRVAIISIYRSPSTSGKNYINELRSVLVLLSSSVNFIIIAGDFNINMLKY